MIGTSNRSVSKDLNSKAQTILSKLIAFPVLGGESNNSIADWIENYLTEHGVSFHNVFNEEGNKRSIHCRIGPAVDCLLYTSPSPRDATLSRMPSSA